MLDFFSSKKSKKHHHQHHEHHKHHDHHEESRHRHQHGKKESDSPLLSANDEEFLERIVSQDDSSPPSPPHLHMPGEAQLLEADDILGNEAERHKEAQRGPTLLEDRDSDDEDAKGKHEGHDKHPDKATSRWSLVQRFKFKKDSTGHSHEHGKGDGIVSPEEAARENDELAAVLDRLNLSSGHGRTLSLSKESREVVQRFNLILKDIVTGAPTAYDDLVQLLDSSQGQLEKSYDRLPPYLQKLVKQLPKKWSKGIGAEMVAAAAAAEGASKNQAAGMASAARKSGVRMPSLKDMVTKPGAIATLLRSAMNFLKFRFPAFMGTSALWSLGVFVLLLALWYCHKRGREVRLGKERLAAEDAARFEELDDDDDDISNGTYSPTGAAYAERRKLPSHHSGRLIEG